jgi:hypothetical protein
LVLVFFRTKNSSPYCLYRLILLTFLFPLSFYGV